MVDRTIRVQLVGDATSLVNAAKAAREALAGVADVNLGGVSGSMGDVGAAAEDAAGKTGGWSEALKTGLSVVGIDSAFQVIKDGLASAVQAGLDYQTNMNTLKAVTGASAGQMTLLGDKAKELGSDISIPGISAADAAEGMAELAKGGFSVAQALTAAKGTMLLATAAQISGAEAAEIQVNALNAFRLSAESAGHVSDVLANSANAASGTVGDMAAALKQSATVASSFGISVDDTATSLGLMAKNGIMGSDAGTSLKTALVNLSSPTKQQRAAMQDLNLTVFDAQGNFVGMKSVTEQLSTAHGELTTEAYASAAGIVFGTDALRVANVLGAEGTAGWTKMATAVGKAGGAEELAAAQTQGLVGALGAITSTTESLATNVFEQLQPAMAAIVNIGTGLVTVLTGVFNWFTNLPGPIQAVATAFAALVALEALTGWLTAVASIGPLMSVTAAEVALAGGWMQVTMNMVSAAASRMWAAIGGWIGVGIAAGIAVVVGAISLFTGGTDEAALAAEAAATAVKQLADAYQRSNGLIDANVRKTALEVVKSYKDEEQGIDGLMGYLTRLGVSQKTAVDATLGNAAAGKQVEDAYHAQRDAITSLTDAEIYRQFGTKNAAREAIEALDREHTAWLALLEASGMAPAEAAAAADAISGGMGEAEAATTAAAGAVTLYSDKLSYIAPGFEDAASAAETYSKAIDQAAKNAQVLADSTAASQMLAKFKADADAASRSGDIFAALLDKLDGRNRSYDDTLANSEKTMQAMIEAWDKGTASATENTEAGQVNQQNLLDWDVTALNASKDGQALYGTLGDVATGYGDTINGAYQNALATSGQTDATAKQAEAMEAAAVSGGTYRARFIEIADAHLHDTDAAVALADKLGIVDAQTIRDKGFSVLAEDADAQAKLKAAEDAKIRDKWFSVFADTAAAQNQVTVLNATIKEIDGKQVKFAAVGSIIVQLDDSAKAYMNDPNFVFGKTAETGTKLGGARAEGGWITGPGGPKTDSIATRLSTGEFVVNAAQAGKHGALLVAINEGAMGFAEGGAVPAGPAAGGTDASATAVVSTPDPEAFKAVWEAIAAAVADAWTTIIQPTLQALTDASVAEGVTQQSLLNDYVTPSWTAIGATVQNTVGTVVVPTFDALNVATNQVGATAIALRDQSVNPAWQGMNEQITGIWGWFGGSIFPAYTAGMANLGAGAQNLAATTSTSWQQIGQTVTDTYNGQIVPAWNGVQSFANATGSFFSGIAAGTASARDTTTSDIATITTAIDTFFENVNGKAGTTTTTTTTGSIGVQALADGGIITQGTGPRADDVHIRASRGEYVVNAAATARHRDTLDAINYGGAYADGGVIGEAIGTKVQDAIVSVTQAAIEAGVTQALASFASNAGNFVSNGNWGPVNLSGLAENAAAAKAYIEANFGGVSSIGGFGGGSVSTSDHPTGKALDVMIADYQSPGGIAAGDAIAEWFYMNPNAFGTKYEIWRDRIRDAGGGWEPYTHPTMHNDTGQHRDHVHLSFLTGTGGFTGQAVVPADDMTGGSWLSTILAKVKSTPTFRPTVGSTGGGGVEQWRAMALQALAATGQSPSWITAMLAQMNTESSGNPQAIQTTDINAQRGDPSKGLLQVIGSTFRDTLARHGHSELIPAGQYDPWANMIAAIYYTVDKFGSLAKWNAAIGGNANPYDNGGMLPVGWSQTFNGTGSPEAVMTDRQWSIASRAMNHVIGGGNGGGGNYTINARVFIGNREITDIARVEAEVAMDNGFTEFANQVNRQRVQAT